MPQFIVCRLSDANGVFTHHTLSMGQVEVRSPNADTEVERMALRASCIASSIDPGVLEISPRLVAVVEKNDAQSAMNVAEGLFLAALDLLSTEIPTPSNFELLKVGYTREFPAGQPEGFIPPRVPGPSIAFLINQSEFRAVDFLERITSGPPSNLHTRYKRAAHWLRISKWEHNQHVATLQRWLAIEACIKKNQNDNLGSFIRTSLGFPSPRWLKNCNTDLSSRLSSHDKYRDWKKRIPRLIGRLSRWRNVTVHEGLRPYDTPTEDLACFSTVTTLAANRIMKLLKDAISSDFGGIDEFHDRFWELQESDPFAYRFITGTVLNSLENPSA